MVFDRLNFYLSDFIEELVEHVLVFAVIFSDIRQNSISCKEVVFPLEDIKAVPAVQASNNENMEIVLNVVLSLVVFDDS